MMNAIIEITPQSERSCLVLVSGKLIIDIAELDTLIKVLRIHLADTVLIDLLIRNGLLCRLRDLRLLSLLGLSFQDLLLLVRSQDRTGLTSVYDFCFYLVRLCFSMRLYGLHLLGCRHKALIPPFHIYFSVWHHTCFWSHKVLLRDT